MAKIVEIGRFDNVIDAMRVQSILEDADIEAEVFDQHAGTMLPHIAGIGIRVMVRPEDADRARAVLAADAAQRRSGESEEEEDDDDDHDDENDAS
jgi:hypothetical protein